MLADLLWQNDRDLADACLVHPFVRGLADGSLPTARYRDYVAQDAFFLRAFAAAYALAGARCRDAAGQQLYAQLAQGVDDELRLHRQQAERLGIDLSTQDRDAARKLVLGQVQGEPDDATVEVLVDFVVARQALTERLGTIDAASEEDIRLLYDGAPALWNRVCVTVVGVPVADAERATRLLARGAGLLDLGQRIEGAQALATPSQGCVVLAQLPPELREALDGATVGRRVGPVVVSSTQGDTAYFFRISERQVIRFDEAAGDVARIAGSLQQSPQRVVLQWVGLTVLDRVAVNPRYGRVAANVNGGISVVPPATPVVPVTAIRLPTPTADPAAGSSGPDAGGSGAGGPGAAGSNAGGSTGAGPTPTP